MTPTRSVIVTCTPALSMDRFKRPELALSLIFIIHTLHTFVLRAVPFTVRLLAASFFHPGVGPHVDTRMLCVMCRTRLIRILHMTNTL